MLKAVALAAALFGGVAAPAVFTAKAPAAPGAPSFQPKTTASQSFAPTCSADPQKQDTRVEPAWVGQSYAGDGCTAPSLPKFVDGFAASRAEVLASMAAQKKYIVQADAYQQCIANYVAARRAAADRGVKKMDVALVTIENHRLAAAETSKQKVADQVKLTIAAFNDAGSNDCK